MVPPEKGCFFAFNSFTRKGLRLVNINFRKSDNSYELLNLTLSANFNARQVK